MAITVFVEADIIEESKELDLTQMNTEMRNIYDEMLKIIAKNNMYYNKLNQNTPNRTHIVTPIKYITSNPIPIPCKQYK